MNSEAIEAEAGEQVRRIRYQPALDGIRGLAVSAVLVYHGRVSWMPGGYLGVDAFFVLSGYLITALLVAEWRENATISLRAFWARRARRLFPALGLVLGAVILYAVALARADQLTTLRHDAFATLAYFANWRAIFSGHAYMDQFALPSPLMHTWSLAIEEQWYVVWPLLLLGMLRLRGVGLRGALTVSVVLAGASAGWMAWLQRSDADVSRAYYGTDTRAQSLLAGAIVALAFAIHPRIRSRAAHAAVRVAAAGGVVVTGWLWWTAEQTGHALYRGGFLLGSVSVAAVIVSVVQPDPGSIGAALSLAPVRWVGRISYGLYLWHWPVYVVLTPGRTGLNTVPLFALRIAVTVAIAALSFYLVEAPIRRGALRRVWRGMALAPVTVGVGAVILVTGLVVSTQGGHASVVLTRTAATPEDPTSGHWTRVLLVGDSVMTTIGPGLVHQGDAHHLLVADYGVPGCGLLRAPIVHNGKVTDIPAACRRWPVVWAQLLDQFHPSVVGLHTSTWDIFDRRVDGRTLRVGTHEFDAYMLSEMREAVDVLSSRGARVAVLTAPYYHIRDGLQIEDAGRSSYNPTLVDRYNADLRELGRRNPDRVRVIDLNHFACPGGKYTNSLHGVADFRGDGVHFTPEGSDLVGKWMAPQLEAMNPSPRA